MRVCACVGLGGRASELQRTSGGHRIKCALRNRSHCVYYNNNNMVGRCVSVSCMPACLLPLWQQAGGGGGTARISTRPPLTAASQQDTPIHTHTRNTPLIGRRGAFEWWRCAPVVCPRHPYLYIYTWPVIGTSEALLEREPNAHTYTHARRESCGGGCESVQATRTKTMYRERERE